MCIFLPRLVNLLFSLRSFWSHELYKMNYAVCWVRTAICQAKERCASNETMYEEREKATNQILHFRFPVLLFVYLISLLGNVVHHRPKRKITFYADEKTGYGRLRNSCLNVFKGEEAVCTHAHTPQWERRQRVEGNDTQYYLYEL